MHWPSNCLREFGITAFGYTVELGGIAIDPQPGPLAEQRAVRDAERYLFAQSRAGPRGQGTDRRHAAKTATRWAAMLEVRVEGLPFGLGTHAQWDRKLDGRLAQAVMAVQAIKGVEIGLGFEAARRRGSQVHDPIHYDETQEVTPNLGYVRPTNNAGGLEAGMTNGQPLVIRAAKKPISTLRKPLESVNLATKQAEAAAYERQRRLRGAGGRSDSGKCRGLSRSPGGRSTNSAATAWPRCGPAGICS